MEAVESFPSDCAKKMRAYGHVRDSPDDRDLHRPAVPVVVGQVFSDIDLRKTKTLPPVYDQGALGSCTGNATVFAVEFLEVAKQPRSRLFNYYCARSLEGTTATDSGAQLRDAIKATVKFGTCLESTWPYVITNFSKKPSTQAFNEAVKEETLQYRRVPQTLASIHDVLSSGFPVPFGFQVYSSFESPEVAKTGIVPFPDTKREELLGGHAVAIIGYIQESHRFLVRNSWGTAWGQQGYFTLPVNYVEDPKFCSDFWEITKESL